MKTLITVMMLAFTSALVHAQETNQCPTSNGYISTNVQAEAKASFLQTVEHHWKFEFWRGAVCSGRPDDQYQDNQDFNSNSNQCSGAITFKTNRNNQLNYTPMTLSWGANLTDDDTFTVDLNDHRTRAVYDYVGGDCTSRRWGSKLEYANVTYETKAVIKVPQDVWVVQVRAKAQVSQHSDITELHPRIGRVALKDDKNPDAWLQSLSEHEWTYLYVEPGEPLELALSYSNPGLDGEKKYNVRYYFKFIGHNRCMEILGDPKTVNYSPEYLQNQILSEIKSPEDYHNYAVKLGCLRNPVFLKAAMNNSRPDALVPALKSLNKQTESVIDQAKSNNGMYATPFLTTILDMTLVDVSRFALTDLLNYCKTYRDFTRETAVNPQVTEVAGVEYMMLTYSHLEKIYSELATQSLATLVSNAQVWSEHKFTYAQLFDGNVEAQKALRAYQQAMIQMGLEIYTTLSKDISTKVPQVEISKSYRDQLLSDLQKAKTFAGYVNVSIRQMLRNFGNRSNNVIEIGQLTGNVNQLLALHQRIHSEMHEFFKWFVSTSNGGDNGDRFVSTLAMLQNEILQPSAENLSAISSTEKHFKSLDDKFVRRAELNKLNQQIQNCIFHPYGGGQ